MSRRLAGLTALAAADPGVTSLLVFGSSTRGGRPRRDEWSDIDANVFLADDEAGLRAGARWSFLPDRDDIVLTAREGADGGVALWADAMVCEFGAGRPWVVRDPHREVLLDGGDIVFGDPPAPPDALDQLGLFLVKLLIGHGRIRRGEVVAGNAHLRVYAVTALAEALRSRLAPHRDRNPFDPLRRLEEALPDAAHRIGELQSTPPDVCAHGLLDLAEESLGPGWPEFPSVAAGVVRAALLR